MWCCLLEFRRETTGIGGVWVTSETSGGVLKCVSLPDLALAAGMCGC